MPGTVNTCKELGLLITWILNGETRIDFINGSEQVKAFLKKDYYFDKGLGFWKRLIFFSCAPGVDLSNPAFQLFNKTVFQNCVTI